MKKLVSFRLSEEARRKLRQIAERSGETMTDVLERLLSKEVGSDGEK